MISILGWCYYYTENTKLDGSAVARDVDGEELENQEKDIFYNVYPEKLDNVDLEEIKKEKEWAKKGDLGVFINCPKCGMSIVLEDGEIPEEGEFDWMPESVEYGSMEYFFIIDIIQGMIAQANLLKKSLENIPGGTRSKMYSKICSTRHYLIAHRKKTIGRR